MAWSSGGRTTTISWWPVPGWLQGGDDGLLCCLLLERRSLLTDGRGDGSAWRLVEQCSVSVVLLEIVLTTCPCPVVAPFPSHSGTSRC
jgi:hypothetical protein